MNNDFNNMVNKIIKAIEEIYPENSKEDIHKKCILYMIMKMCENEEIFNNNLYLLDKEAENGASANYQKKFKL